MDRHSRYPLSITIADALFEISVKSTNTIWPQLLLFDLNFFLSLLTKVVYLLKNIFSEVELGPKALLVKFFEPICPMRFVNAHGKVMLHRAFIFRVECPNIADFINKVFYLKSVYTSDIIFIYVVAWMLSAWAGKESVFLVAGEWVYIGEDAIGQASLTPTILQEHLLPHVDILTSSTSTYMGILLITWSVTSRKIFRKTEQSHRLHGVRLKLA